MPEELRADCTRCAGLCCVGPAFAKSDDFAIDKPAGRPCPNLQQDFRCGIHQHLRQRGFPGCTVYDCFGAGQKITQLTFAGQDWRQRSDMLAAFPIMRQLHELLWYLTAALALQPSNGTALGLARDETDRLTRSTPAKLLKIDVATHRQSVNTLLLQTSDEVRKGTLRADHRGADLVGKNLTHANLKGANLRGAYLIGADLRNVDLSLADLTGADLRGAKLNGTDLSESMFLTQSQVDAGSGDTRTKLPAALIHPPHWPS
jgi:uncharacterized protein YjbI with pentapeptide repeats